MIAKGYDFPNLTLVGIVDIDSMLYSSELKSFRKSLPNIKPSYWQIRSKI